MNTWANDPTLFAERESREAAYAARQEAVERFSPMPDYSANIKARTDAEQTIELLGEQSIRFWETLIVLAQSKLPAKPAPIERLPAFSDEEARRFESQVMPYGNHYGKEVGCVPCAYLLFLTEGDTFSQQIKRYVKSKRFARRQEESDANT